MTPLRFTVEGAPVGKGRPEAVVIRVQGRHVAKLHTPAKTRHYEKAVAAAARAASIGSPLTCRVGLLARIFHPFTPGAKPDGSNVLKTIEDGMNTVVYTDDRQVQVGAFVVSIDPDRPRVEVEVTPLPCETCILCGHPLTLPEIP